MSQRDRQVAAYRRSLVGQVKIKARGKAVAEAVAWVREEHPDVWKRFLDRATAEVTFEVLERERPS